MPFDPLNVIVEILGQPAESMRSPIGVEYQCPFMNSLCTKQSHRIDGPYPLCTIIQGKKNPKNICVCPKRFYSIDIVADVIEHCWPGDPPSNPRLAYEVQMKKFGNVDFVIADIDANNGSVKKFVSVELQAVDITGSVESAYTAVTNSEMMPKRPRYGINWANVRKRFISQLISKGFYHHHWESKMIAVVQTSLYKKMKEYINFDEFDPKGDSNIVFMLYDYKLKDDGENGELELVFDKAIGTSHSSLMTGSLYRRPPSVQEFHSKIIQCIAGI